jgi:hypothetical protein
MDKPVYLQGQIMVDDFAAYMAECRMPVVTQWRQS